MSVITYNGVTLPYAQTTDCQQVPTSDPSNTDFCLLHFDIVVQCFFCTDWIATYCPSLVKNGIALTQNPADTMNVIRYMLLQRRKQLQIKVNDVDIIPQKQGENLGTCDAQNGPIPQYCNITALSNTTFWINYRIKAAYWENTAKGVTLEASPFVANADGSAVLTNRWSETVKLNFANFSTRIREGTYMIRSDNTQGWTADSDAVRTMCTVFNVPYGFTRQSRSFSVSPDGLKVSYHIVDQEEFRMPPYPAYRARGTYTESYAPYGVQKFGLCSLRLEGGSTVDPGSYAPVSSQAQLLALALAIVTNKLSVSGAEGDKVKGFRMMQGCTIEMGMYENWVSVSMKCRLNTAEQAENGRVAGLTSFNVEDVVYVPYSAATASPTPTYPMRGTAGLILQAAKYYDPNIVSNSINPNTGNYYDGVSPGEAGSIVEF